MIVTGTLINVSTILVGSTIGILLRSNLPHRFIKIVFQGIGLFTIYLGIKMALSQNHLLILVFSLILGGISGELLQLENRLGKATSQLKNKLKLKHDKFSEGLITAFLLYCMGSLTILGAMEEGLGNGYELLLTKSIMDGFASIALSSAFGLGVAFSVLPLFIYQAGLTIAAAYWGNFMPESVILQITSTGGILLIGLGINILEIKKISILNLLPSLLYAMVFSWIFLQFFAQ